MVQGSNVQKLGIVIKVIIEDLITRENYVGMSHLILLVEYVCIIRQILRNATSGVSYEGFGYEVSEHFPNWGSHHYLQSIGTSPFSKFVFMYSFSRTGKFLITYLIV